MGSAPLRPEAFAGAAPTADGSPRAPAAMWISAPEINLPPSRPFISALLEPAMIIGGLPFLPFTARSPGISPPGALSIAPFPDPPFSGQDLKWRQAAFQFGRLSGRSLHAAPVLRTQSIAQNTS
jgi:hypothetical protein